MFGRQWLHWKSSEELNHRDQLAAVINDHTTPQLNLDFDEVLLKCRQMLEKIMTSMSKPFLSQMEEMVYQNLKENCAGMGPSASASQQLEMKPTENNNNNVISDDDTDAVVDANGKSTNVSAAQSHRSADHSSSSKSSKISSVDDIWRPSTEWRKKGARQAVGKVAWSSVEEEQVYQGVLAHGVGNWALIRSEFVPNRTNVDIKDKWRTMKRQQRLSVLAAKFGPLPADCLDG